MKIAPFAVSPFMFVFQAQAEDSYRQEWALNPNNEICTNWQGGRLPALGYKSQQ